MSDSLRNKIFDVIKEIEYPSSQQELLRIASISRDHFLLVLSVLLDPDNFLGLPGSEKKLPAIKETILGLEEVRRGYGSDEKGISPNYFAILFAAYANPRAERYTEEFHLSVLTRRAGFVADILSVFNRDENYATAFLNCFANCACMFTNDPSELFPLVGRLFIDPETNRRAMWLLVLRIAETNTPISKFEKFFGMLAEIDLELVAKNLGHVFYSETSCSLQARDTAASILLKLAEDPKRLKKILRTLASCSTKRELYTLILNSAPNNQALDLRTPAEPPRFVHHRPFDRTGFARHQRRCRRSGQLY